MSAVPLRAETAGEAADRLREEGLTLFPLGSPYEQPPSYFVERHGAEAPRKWPKTPRVEWAEFQQREPTDAEWDRWRRNFPRANWGIACGREIVVVDADSNESVGWIESGGITRTPRWVETAKGRHYWFQRNPAIEIRNSTGKHKIDIRGYGGYVVAPGSVHETGVVYTEHRADGIDCDFRELPMLTAADLAAIQRFNGAPAPAMQDGKWVVQQSLVNAVVEKGQRNSALAASVGAWINEGLGLDQLLARAHAWNRALSEPLSDGEVNQTVLSIMATHVRRHGPQAEAHEQRDQNVEFFSDVPLGDIETAELVPPPTILDPYIPKHEVTLLSGHGGAGKSQLALAIGAHIAAGSPWGGCEVEQGRVLFVSMEDRADIVRWRLKRICAVYGLDVRAVVANLRVVDSTNHPDASLAVEQTVAGVKSLVFTPAMARLRSIAAGCALVIIDNASDAFGADEIVRRQVRAFISGLAHMAREIDGAVMLLAHVDKDSAKHGSKGESYSGSTGWHNSVRSRMALVLEKEAGTLALKHEKANLTKKAADLPMEFEKDVLVPAARSATVESIQRNQDDDTLLEAIAAAIRGGETIPAAEAGASPWHHALAGRPEFAPFERATRGKKRAQEALRRLKRAGVVVEVAYVKANRHASVRLDLAPNAASRFGADTPDSTRAAPNSAPNSARVNYPHTPHASFDARMGARRMDATSESGPFDAFDAFDANRGEDHEF